MQQEILNVTLDPKLKKQLKKQIERRHDKEPAFRRKYNLETLAVLLFALLAALFLRGFVFQNTQVQGESMMPNFVNGEQVFVEKLSYLFSEPERGDVIICRYGDTSSPVIKRVIALPGETIRITGGKVFINDQELDESHYWSGTMFSDMSSVTVPEGNVFVMGDNRNASLDSRQEGPVPYYRIIGKAHFIIYPFDSFGSTQGF